MAFGVSLLLTFSPLSEGKKTFYPHKSVLLNVPDKSHGAFKEYLQL